MIVVVVLGRGSHYVKCSFSGCKDGLSPFANGLFYGEAYCMTQTDDYAKVDLDAVRFKEIQSALC